nr:ATP-dependent zinc metalloprotease FtsH [uncultured Peptostreptococcus sp.]
MKKSLRGAGLYLILLVIIFFGVRYGTNQASDIKNLEFSRVYKELKVGNIKSLHIIDDTGIEGSLKKPSIKFKSYIPSDIRSEQLSKDLLNGVQKNNLVIDGESKPKTPWIVEMIPTILLLIFMAVAFFMLMNQSQGGGGRMMSFSKSKAKLHKGDEKVKVVFDDVAGLNEEKDELQEVVDFLKNPKKYMELGARIPKGILMVGPPGTGKTYLSKAVAGEAGVPFFSISGSDFVEMFVGVGASRVRDLFEQAKKESPAIVFIDEIDAVGRKRGAGLGGGHDEREQTLNQLLVEMDGFGINQGIIIMAATNRPDILDPALLRPGRFDRQVVVGRPDVKGREAIFKVHSRKKPLADDVDLSVLAKFTAGFTPADIENIMNEAAILTARKREDRISMATIEEAITKTVVGVAKKSKIITEKERNLTAYHEAGHAVCAHVLDLMDPVHQVTIIPRGMAGGFTMQLPTEDKYYATRGEMLQELIVLLGGRVSEEINLDDISTGASNDLERVTSLARNMVTKYGMSSKLGPLTFDSNDEVFLGNSIGHSRQYSEEVASEIDAEVRKIVVDAYEKTRDILKSNQARLDYIARALLEYETLNDKQFEEAFEMRLALRVEEKAENISTIDDSEDLTRTDNKETDSKETNSKETDNKEIDSKETDSKEIDNI